SLSVFSCALLANSAKVFKYCGASRLDIWLLLRLEKLVHLALEPDDMLNFGNGYCMALRLEQEL
ncbi:MAG: hypothetical protein ACXWC1_04745, partial [Burkholderiales bacterium]